MPPGAWLTSLSWVQPTEIASAIFLGTFYSYGYIIIGGISLFGEVDQHSEPCEFCSCTLFCEVLKYDIYVIISSLPLKITLFWSLPNIHDCRKG